MEASHPCTAPALDLDHSPVQSWMEWTQLGTILWPVLGKKSSPQPWDVAGMVAETMDLGVMVREQPGLDQSVHLPSRLRYGYMSSLVVLSLAFMLSISHPAYLPGVVLLPSTQGQLGAQLFFPNSRHPCLDPRVHPIF